MMWIGIMIMVSPVGSVHLPLQPSSVTFSLSWRWCYISSIRRLGFLWDRFERRGMTVEADVVVVGSSRVGGDGLFAVGCPAEETQAVVSLLQLLVMWLVVGVVGSDGSWPGHSH